MFEIIGQIVVGIILLCFAILLIEVMRRIYGSFKLTNIRLRLRYGRGNKWSGFRELGFRKYMQAVWFEFISNYTYSRYGGILLYKSGRIGRERFYGT